MRLANLTMGLILLAIIPLPAIASAPSQTIKVQLKLETRDYPWWQELYLQVSGFAAPVYADAVITFSVHYHLESPQKQIKKVPKNAPAQYRIVWFNLGIPRQSQQKWLKFSQTWGPLNGPSQEITPGRYEVRATIDWANQTNQFRQNWHQAFANSRPGKVEVHHADKPGGSAVTFLINPTAFERISEEYIHFYVQQMKILNQIFTEFKNRREEVLNLQQDILSGNKNFFVQDNKFSFRQWQQWLRRLLNQITAVEKALAHHSQKVYPFRYPVTFNALKSYTELLLRAMKIAHNKIYQRYVAKQRYRRSDRMDIVNFSLILRTIQNKQIKSARELNIAAKEILIH